MSRNKKASKQGKPVQNNRAPRPGNVNGQSPVRKQQNPTTKEVLSENVGKDNSPVNPERKKKGFFARLFSILFGKGEYIEDKRDTEQHNDAPSQSCNEIHVLPVNPCGPEETEAPFMEHKNEERAETVGSVESESDKTSSVDADPSECLEDEKNDESKEVLADAKNEVGDSNFTVDNSISDGIVISKREMSEIRGKINETFKEMGSSMDSESADIATLFDTLLGEIMSVYNRVADSEKELNNAKAKNKKLEDQCTNQGTAQKKFKNLKDDLEKKEKELSSITDKYTDADTKRRDAERRIDEISREKKNLQKELVEERSAKKKAENDLDNARNEMESLREKISKLSDSETGELLSQIDKTNSEIAKLNRIVAEKEKAIASREEKIAELENTISSKDEGIAQLLAQVKEEQDKVEKYWTRIKELDLKDKENQKTIYEKDMEISDRDRENKQLNEKIKNKDQEISAYKKNVADLKSSLNKERENVKAEKATVENLRKDIKARDAEILGLQKEIEGDKNEITDLKELVANKEDMIIAADTRHLASVERTRDILLTVAEGLDSILDEGGYENGSGDMADNCAEDETLNRTQFARILSDLKAVDVQKTGNTDAFLSECMHILTEDIEKGMDGVILPLARLCAYSRIPFMRDDRGDDNMRLDRRLISRMESALTGLLAIVGIELIAPVPFCDRLDEGEYEDGTGNVPNLDYICPNSRAHLDNVDREEVKNIVTDVIRIGYRRNGRIVEKAVVLI